MKKIMNLLNLIPEQFLPKDIKNTKKMMNEIYQNGNVEEVVAKLSKDYDLEALLKNAKTYTKNPIVKKYLNQLGVDLEKIEYDINNKFLKNNIQTKATKSVVVSENLNNYTFKKENKFSNAKFKK